MGPHSNGLETRYVCVEGRALVDIKSCDLVETQFEDVLVTLGNDRVPAGVQGQFDRELTVGC